MVKHDKEFTEDLKHESKVELEGSHFKDRIFIKLLKNRKKTQKGSRIAKLAI